MATPVSWLLIEKGWEVVDRDGDSAGHVVEVLANEKLDIFDGFTMKHLRIEHERYVPAEHVVVITEGRIELSLTAEQVSELDLYDRGRRFRR